jgi:hypothetical protein
MAGDEGSQAYWFIELKVEVIMKGKQRSISGEKGAVPGV